MIEQCIGDLKRVQNRCIAVNYREQTLIRYNYDSIHVIAELFYTRFGSQGSFRSFENERFCDDTYSQRSEVLSDLRYDRSRACSRSAAHSRRYEYHIGIGEHFRHGIPVFFDRFFADLNVRARAETFRKTLSYLDLRLRVVMI